MRRVTLISILFFFVMACETSPTAKITLPPPSATLPMPTRTPAKTTTPRSNRFGNNRPCPHDDTKYPPTHTLSSARNMALDMIAESIIDYAVSRSQIKYDNDRCNGINFGGYIQVDNPRDIVNLITFTFFSNWGILK